MQWWIRPGTSRCWAIRNPSPSFPSSASGAEPDVLVVDLRVAAEHPVVLVGLLHVGDVAKEVDTGRVDRDDEHRGSLVRLSVGIGDRHHDQEVRDRAVRGEPLVPVEDVAVSVPNGARPELGRVRAGGVGLGHRERRPNLTGEERVEPALLLRVGARKSEDLAVTRSRAPGSRTPVGRRSTCRGSRSSARASPARTPDHRAPVAGAPPTGPRSLTRVWSGA